MGSSSILTIVAVVLVLLAGLSIYTTVKGRDRRRAADVSAREAGGETADDTAKARQSSGREVERSAVGTVEESRAAPPAQWAPMDEETYGVTRRQFFNRSIVTMFGLGLTTFGSTTIAFLWPSLSGGFGSKIRVDEVSAILAKVADTREPVYVPEGRFYIAPFPKDSVEKAKSVYTGGVLVGMEAGVVALYQKCVHLGCRVPWCKASQWFECPCHGSQYNRVGEKKGGPAPRGMDRFPIALSGGQVVVDTSQIIQGPPVGVNTTGQEAEGPHCA